MREQEDTMAEAHDSWLSGLGIDVDKVLKSLGPPMPEVPMPAAPADSALYRQLLGDDSHFQSDCDFVRFIGGALSCTQS